jgi:hypothetical protein
MVVDIEFLSRILKMVANTDVVSGTSHIDLICFRVPNTIAWVTGAGPDKCGGATGHSETFKSVFLKWWFWRSSEKLLCLHIEGFFCDSPVHPFNFIFDDCCLEVHFDPRKRQKLVYSVLPAR